MTQTSSQNPSVATPENMARVALATPAPRPSAAGLLQGSGVYGQQNRRDAHVPASEITCI